MHIGVLVRKDISEAGIPDFGMTSAETAVTNMNAFWPINEMGLLTITRHSSSSKMASEQIFWNDSGISS
ncbi:hypothetical protein D3C84_1219990 [compost metagenome]